MSFTSSTCSVLVCLMIQIKLIFLYRKPNKRQWQTCGFASSFMQVLEPLQFFLTEDLGQTRVHQHIKQQIFHTPFVKDVSTVQGASFCVLKGWHPPAFFLVSAAGVRPLASSNSNRLCTDRACFVMCSVNWRCSLDGSDK